MTTETKAEFNWEYDDGIWSLWSIFYADDYCFRWRINVCENGLFYVSQSDPELTDWKDGYATLSAAKAFCETAERLNREDTKQAT